jgi:arsenical pump membrane protein
LCIGRGADTNRSHQYLAHALASFTGHSNIQAIWVAGIIVADASILINNLPAGLIAGSVGHMIHLPLQNSSALVIGVDLGPILSITGSLATWLWLIAVRREGEHLSAIQFLLLGMVMIPPALIGALAALSVVTK